MGKPKHPTPIGSFTALEKQSPVIMDSRTIGIPLSDPEGQVHRVQRRSRHLGRGLRAQRAVVGGVARQCERSHGDQPEPDNAAWYYSTVSIGDPIIVHA